MAPRSLRPERLPLTAAQRAANASAAPFGPVTTALHGTQDMRGFFAAAATTLQEYDWTRPGACCLLGDDEFPRGHVSIWAATAMEDLP